MVTRFYDTVSTRDIPVSQTNPMPITPVDAILPAGTDRSGTATTISGGLNVPANTSRRALTGQNVSAVNIGYNPFGGTAVIGGAGTFTVLPGAAFTITTRNLVNFIAASGTAAVSMIES
jgi:hypothetical protein